MSSGIQLSNAKPGGRPRSSLRRGESPWFPFDLTSEDLCLNFNKVHQGYIFHDFKMSMFCKVELSGQKVRRQHNHGKKDPIMIKINPFFDTFCNFLLASSWCVHVQIVISDVCSVWSEKMTSLLFVVSGTRRARTSGSSRSSDSKFTRFHK